ncbi:sensor histidine kinase [Xylophilus sp. ASV27]|uniref:sensor histidine kinase n=1 Tax=Xylophilus sp. ASV27 TaxID=2795129 RepID=UPI0018ED0CC4
MSAGVLPLAPAARGGDALQPSRDAPEPRVAERTAWTEPVREQERTRIAREAHAELGRLLVALKMDVDWLDKRLGEQAGRSPEAAQAMRLEMRCKCHGMSGLIARTVDHVGRIVSGLRPGILDHQGLWAALEWQAHEFARSAELALDWDMQVDASLRLPEPAAIAVLRIFQEMLGNVGRHARARRVAVCLRESAGMLELRVQDDGRGAPPRAFEAHGAHGVQGMRERALHLGGQIEVHGDVGRGATLCLRLPLARARQ